VADELLLDGLWDCFYDCHMATTVEKLAATRGISRREQDEFAAESHRRAIVAAQGGRFSDEIVAVDTASGRLESDEHPRADSSLERLSSLKPSFAKDGTITAGNSSGLNDGGAAVVLSSRQPRAGGKPLAELLDFTVVGVDPMEMGLGPVKAIRELLARNSLAITNIDLWEINEAFSAQALAVLSELRLPIDRVNVNGGAVALGHPIGASGARVLVTLIHEMRRRNVELGVASLCVGGGLGIAALIRLGA
jgi:acetyl-CoA C-acetyltransferase